MLPSSCANANLRFSESDERRKRDLKPRTKKKETKFFEIEIF